VPSQLVQLEGKIINKFNFFFHLLASIHCTLPHLISPHCNNCNTLHHTVTHCPALRQSCLVPSYTEQHSATQSNILEHTETHCNTLSHAKTVRSPSLPRFLAARAHTHTHLFLFYTLSLTHTCVCTYTCRCTFNY